MTKTVFLTPDGRDVIIEGPIHSDRFPVEELRSPGVLVAVAVLKQGSRLVAALQLEDKVVP